MRKNLPILTLLLAGLLTACGEQPTSEPMSQSDAQNLKTTFLQSNPFFIASLNNPAGLLNTAGAQGLPGPIAALGAAMGFDLEPASLACSVNSSGNTQDQDRDGVPVGASYTADCQQGNNSFKARMSLRDKDDNDPRSGYVLDTQEFQLVLNKGQSNETGLVLDLDLDLTQRNPNYNLYHNFSLTLYNRSNRYNLAYTYTTTYTPDDPQNPFYAGTIDFSGIFDYRYNGKWYRLNAQGISLKYSRTCTQSFVGGRVRLEDSRGNHLEIIYNGCNNISTTYNG